MGDDETIIKFNVRVVDIDNESFASGENVWYKIGEESVVVSSSTIQHEGHNDKGSELCYYNETWLIVQMTENIWIKFGRRRF